MKKLFSFLFNDGLIYPPHKIRDTNQSCGVRYNLSVLKSVIEAKRFNLQDVMTDNKSILRVKTYFPK